MNSPSTPPILPFSTIEDRLVEEVRQLGHQVMEDWALKAEDRAGEEFKQSRPEGRIAKKKP